MGQEFALCCEVHCITCLTTRGLLQQDGKLTQIKGLRRSSLQVGPRGTRLNYMLSSYLESNMSLGFCMTRTWLENVERKKKTFHKSNLLKRITGKMVMQLETFLAKFPRWEKKLKFWYLIVRNFEMQKNNNTFTVGVLLEIIHGWWNKWWSSTQPVFSPLQRKTTTKVEILETFIASS